MSRRLLLNVPLVAAALIAGCGGSGPDTPSTAADAAKATPHGALAVGPTDLRVGDATRADRSGVQVLSREAVERRSDRREGVGAGASCADADLLLAAANNAAIAAATLCLLNGERADAGLAPLEPNAKLAAAALEHSRDMVDNQYFGHEGLDGSDAAERIRRTGYLPSDRAWSIGENLAWGTGTLSSPRNIVDAWMHSEGHRANIMTPFKEIGLGIVLGTPRSRDAAGATFTTTFGTVSGGSPRGSESAPGQQAAPVTKPADRRGATRKKARSKRSRAAKRRAAARRAAKRG